MADKYQRIANASAGIDVGTENSTLKDMGNGTFSPVVATSDVKGMAGVVVTTNTGAVTGVFGAIQILEDAVFSLFTETGASGQAMTGFAIPAGTVLYGLITAYTLTSGKVRAYKA